MRTLGRRALAAGLYRSGLLALHRRVVLRDRPVVLMYHRVLQPSEIRPDLDPGMFVSAPAFELQLRHLSRTYQLVHLDDILSWMDGRTSFERPACAITFDDGWQDNYRNAFPLLRRFGAPATVFLITSQIGEPDMLTWDQVREMERHGVRFASHTDTHPDLAALTREALERELRTSKEELERRVEKPSPWFCYPRGSYNGAARDVAARHYAAAVTTARGAVSRSVDRYQVPRLGVHDDIGTTTSLFALRLSTLR